MPDLDQIKQADRKRETGGADWTIGFRHFNQPEVPGQVNAMIEGFLRITVDRGGRTRS